MQKKYKYFKFTLRGQSYSGFYEGLHTGYQICNYLNCKKIICLKLINFHKAHKIRYIFWKKTLHKYLKKFIFF